MEGTHFKWSAAGPGFRTSREQRLCAALDRRDALERALAALKQEQTEVERKAYDPRWADMSDPEPAAAAVKDKAEERDLAEQRVDAARAELLEIAAGPCSLRERAPMRDQPVRAASMQATPSAFAGPPALRVTIMTEADLERYQGQLREVLVVLLYNGAAAAATAALAQGAAAVELRGSPLAALDAAHRCRKEHTSYALAFDSAELPDPAQEPTADDAIDLGNGIVMLPWSEHPRWSSEQQAGADTAAEGRAIVYASPSAARGCGRATHAKDRVLGCFGNLSACVGHIGDWWANPTPTREDLYALELAELAERNREVILLCPTPPAPAPTRQSNEEEGGSEGASPPPPSAEQVLAGMLLYQLMQELDSLDVDLGEHSEVVGTEPMCVFAAGADGRCRNCSQAEEHEWHRPAESDGWTTRALLGHVIEAVREGDEAWCALYGGAYEQQLAALRESPRGAGREAEEALLASMQVDAWSQRGGVPTHDKDTGRFVAHGGGAVGGGAVGGGGGAKL